MATTFPPTSTKGLYAVDEQSRAGELYVSLIAAAIYAVDESQSPCLGGELGGRKGYVMRFGIGYCIALNLSNIFYGTEYVDNHDP